jgi:YccS/YhfK family integral membrane protein
MWFASLLNVLRRLWAYDTFVYSLRVFIALAGVMAACLALGRMDVVITVFLGTVASALAETDDNWLGRLVAELVTLACFALASVVVQVLFPYPWPFVVGLAASAFFFTMLGAIGERYRAIGFGTMTLAIYTMIGVQEGGVAAQGFWHVPLLMMAGAAWYGVLSVLWAALFVHQPVQQRLSNLYILLASYLELKASMFEPVRDVDMEARRLELAQLNSKVVTALNLGKESLFNRLGRSRPGRKTSRYLRLYFIAQDVHERASSSHYPYDELTDTFFHSDLMFRCQRVLSLQGRACRQLAHAIRMRQAFDAEDRHRRQAIEDLDNALAYLRQQDNRGWARLLRSVSALSDNLRELDRRLGRASNPGRGEEQRDQSLFDRSPQSLGEAIDRVRLQFSPSAPVFRYATRLALALAAGYGVLRVVHPEHGYWIVLTTLFVCSASYAATRNRITQRISGTVLGLVAGWALLQLFPDPLLQVLFAVAAGVAFFALRGSRYTLSTASITVMVLLCFNQIGNGYDLIVPRLVDTVLGGLIAGIATLVVLPDWQGRRLTQVAAKALAAHSRYLREIMIQYELGKHDDLAYRVARRNAHNADAAFSMALSNMLAEPGHLRRDADTSLRLLVLSHTLLNYLSGLGAHRHTLSDQASDAAIARLAMGTITALESLASGLVDDRTPLLRASPAEDALAQEAQLLPELGSEDDADDDHSLVLTQLALIVRLLLPLRRVASQLQRQERIHESDEDESTEEKKEEVTPS